MACAKARVDVCMNNTPQHRENLGLWLGLLGVFIFGLTLPMTRLATGTVDAPQMSPWFVTWARAALAGGLSALFLWWFSTGIILWRVKRADNEGRDAHLWSVILGLPLLLGGFGTLHHTLGDSSATGAFVGFVAALAIWGWIELAFLSGIIAGPNTSLCPPEAPLWERFLRACGTIAWHELTLMGTLGL